MQNVLLPRVFFSMEKVEVFKVKIKISDTRMFNLTFGIRELKIL